MPKKEEVFSLSKMTDVLACQMARNEIMVEKIDEHLTEHGAGSVEVINLVTRMTKRGENLESVLDDLGINLPISLSDAMKNMEKNRKKKSKHNT